MNYSSILLFTLCSLFISIHAHSYLTNPVSRSNQKSSNRGCRGPECMGPCDAPTTNVVTPPTYIRRGDTIYAEWPRNNHPGGFIRFAWAKFEESDSHEAFDNNVQFIQCHEVGCGPRNASLPNEGDDGLPDGTVGACHSVFHVPSHLSDGQWTLQWTWFGGGYALSDYYSCADFVIAGGEEGNAPTPKFIGGDFANPGEQKCKFWNTDRIHVCLREPCNTPIYQGVQSGPAYGIEIAETTNV